MHGENGKNRNMKQKNVMNKRIIRDGIIFLSAMCLMTGCVGKKSSEVSGTYICYMNTEETSVVEEPYELEGKTTKKQIAAMLEKLQEKSGSDDYKSVFQSAVKIEDWKFADSKLNIYFNSAYQNMTMEQEVLFRAALVQSLGQIEDVDYIRFFVNGESLMNAEEQEVGYMSPDDFVQNIGSSLHTYQMGKFTLYFANRKGTELISTNVSVRYNSNMSREKVVMEQLMKGPAQSNLVTVIPQETKVLGISVKDGICYVNLDEGFFPSEYTGDPKLIIYSIVDSIVANGIADRVQISVNGDTNVRYMDTVDLSKPLEADEYLVQN